MSAAGEKVPEWMRSQVKRSNSGGILYNAIRIDTGVECDEVPSYDSAVIDSRVARLNAAGKLNSYDAILTQCEALQVELDITKAGLEFAKDAAYRLSGVASEKYSKSDVEAICGIAIAAVHQQNKRQRDALEAQEKVLRTMVEQYASECGECGGKGYIWEGEAITGRGPEDVFPEQSACPECADIRAALATGAAK